MPYIHTKVSNEISPEQEKSLKTQLGEAAWKVGTVADAGF